MPRPFKPRRVSSLPRYIYFKPTGIPMPLLEELVLAIDKVEALRLKDIEKLEQHKCAESMDVAQSTLQRILVSAREKLTRAIIEGRALRIHGDPYALSSDQLCPRCRRRRKDAGNATSQQQDCPECNIDSTA